MTLKRRVAHIIREIAVSPIVLYQKLFSAGTPARCLYMPTCSNYMKEAIRRHGVLSGGLSGLLRVLRCTGLLFERGYDPVPEHAPIRGVLRGYRTFFRFSRGREQDGAE